MTIFLSHDASTLKDGDLLKLHFHQTRKANGEEEQHGPSIKLHPVASEYSTKPSVQFVHGVLYWTVVQTWTRDWVKVVGNDDKGEIFEGWANLFSNSFEVVIRDGKDI